MLNVRPTANAYWDETAGGTVTMGGSGEVWILVTTGNDLTLASDITLPGALWISAGYDTTQTFAGSFNMQSGKTLTFAESGSGTLAIISIAGITGYPNVVNGDFEAANNFVDLRFNDGDYYIHNLSRDSVKADTSIPMNFGTSRFHITGTIDATEFVIVSDSAQVIDGTLSNVTNLTGRLIAWGVVDGGGNTDKLEVEFTPRILPTAPMLGAMAA